MVVVKVIALVLSLGMDTLTVSASLGALQMQNRLTIALTFVAFESGMPIVGLLVGDALGHALGTWTALAGGLLLLGVAGWLTFFERRDEEIDASRHVLVGWTLVATALSVSLDELAVGFSLGMIGVPRAATIVLIACQTFAVTWLGMRLGGVMIRWIEPWGDKIAAGVLAALGLGIVLKAVFQLLR
ncbi:MAG: manganese efflux pump [Firmicutes bacterium]|nr:manganese efflux pump [Bacillota bacterium]